MEDENVDGEGGEQYHEEVYALQICVWGWNIKAVMLMSE